MISHPTPPSSAAQTYGVQVNWTFWLENQMVHLILFGKHSKKHGLWCKAIQFLYDSQSLKLIWLHFVAGSSHTRSNSPVNWLCIKFVIRWFVQMVSTHAWSLVQPHPSPPSILHLWSLPYPTNRKWEPRP